MGFLDLFNFSRKESRVAGAIVQQYAPGQAIWTPDDYEKMMREGYQTSVYVFRAVQIVSEACAGIPWVLYSEKRGEEGRLEEEEVYQHPILSLLKNPNPHQSGAQFIVAAVAFRLLSGQAYLERVGPGVNGTGKPRELYVLRPDRVNVITGTPSDPIRGYEYRVGGRVDRLPPEVVRQWKTFNPLDDFYGMAALKPAARSVDQNNVAKAHNVALMQNNARPSGLLIVKEKLANLKDFITELRENWMGSANAGRPAVLSGDVSWQQTALSPVDLDWLSSQKLSAKEIALAFGVPSILLENSDAATYANYGEARRALYQETVLPLMDNLRDELNAWLVPLFGDGYRLDYDADQIEALQEDREKQWKRTNEAFKAGWLTVDEARSTVGYDAVEDKELGKSFYWQLFKTKVPQLEGGEQEQDRPEAA